MQIKKNKTLYDVEQTKKEWILTIAGNNLLELTVCVSKRDCKTFEELKKYVLSKDFEELTIFEEFY